MTQELAFNSLDNGTAEKYLKQKFAQHGEDEIEADATGGARRTSGVSYRPIKCTFADGQVVELLVTTTGDIFAVKLNGKSLPVRAQESEDEAIAEIVKAMDSGRQRFQQQLTRQKVQLPASIRTPVPKMEILLQQKHAELDKQITEVKMKRDELKSELDTLPLLDDAYQADPNFFTPDQGDHVESKVLVERDNEVADADQQQRNDGGSPVPANTVDEKSEDAQAQAESAGKYNDIAREPVQSEADRAIAANEKEADASLKPFTGINYPQGDDLADNDQLRVSLYY